jgi:hypothetical protein
MVVVGQLYLSISYSYTGLWVGLPRGLSTKSLYVCLDPLLGATCHNSHHHLWSFYNIYREFKSRSSTFLQFSPASNYFLFLGSNLSALFSHIHSLFLRRPDSRLNVPILSCYWSTISQYKNIFLKNGKYRSDRIPIMHCNLLENYICKITTQKIKFH